MPYDPLNDIRKVKEHYESDPMQQRFSALITAESGAGKTFLLRTCRFPIHIDSFDPGGTKCLRPWIEKGDIIADTRWENEDPFEPSVFEEWAKETDYRFKMGYFKLFGTYCLDSLSTFGDSVMNSVLGKSSLAGSQPRMRKDYMPQKIQVVNRIKKFFTIPCDFILTAHLNRLQEKTGTDKYGDPIFSEKYRLKITGDAIVTIPMLFDELYLLKTTDSSKGIQGKIITFAQGKYLARSRLKSDGKLQTEEEADVKKMLKKLGLKWEDKPKLAL